MFGTVLSPNLSPPRPQGRDRDTVGGAGGGACVIIAVVVIIHVGAVAVDHLKVTETATKAEWATRVGSP